MTIRTTVDAERAAPARRRARALRWVPVLALAAVIASSCSSTKKIDTNAADSSAATSSSAGATSGKVEFGKVSVQGAPLESLPETGTDPAVGQKAPVVTGESFDRSPVTLAAKGKPTVIFFLAHWCPHCNREAPLLIADWAQHGQPAGVQLLSVTTGSNENAQNWPPSQWIAGLHWPVPVLADSKAMQAAQAFGLPGYPFFVMLKPDGTVFFRNSGEWPVADFNAKVAELVRAST
jgi:cytochrome c biogenesis protein CcmG/thiol:disulfide interchange protein DsbE